MGFTSSRKLCLRLLPAVFGVLLQPALAHDTFETTVVARLSAANLEVRAILSQFGAGKLLQLADPASPRLGGSNFDALHPKLLEQAGAMFEILAGGAPLPLTEARVLRGEAGEVEFLASFSRPASGDFQFHVAYLARLGRGFTAQMTLLDEAGRGAIITLKERDNPVLQWPVAAGGIAKAEPPAVLPCPEPVVSVSAPAAAVVRPPIDSDPAPATGAAKTGRPLILLALVGLAGWLFWRVRRRVC